MTRILQSIPHITSVYLHLQNNYDSKHFFSYTFIITNNKTPNETTLKYILWFLIEEVIAYNNNIFNNVKFATCFSYSNHHQADISVYNLMVF